MTSKVVRKVCNVYKPLAPYNQAIQIDSFLYISGQVGRNPETMNIVSGGTIAEVEQVLKNVGSILNAAGSSFDKVIKATVLLKDINDLPAVNEVYAKYFSEARPARVACQVAALPMGANVEIEAVAIVGDLIDV